MHIGVTGHQARPGIDWEWVAATVMLEIEKLPEVEGAFSSLAKGSDQIFAECALRRSIPVNAVIPTPDYERFFHGNDLTKYKALLMRCQSFVLRPSAETSSEQAFLEAGHYIVERSQLLFAIWDEKAAGGLGGTADVVMYAENLSKKRIIINPIAKCVKIGA